MLAYGVRFIAIEKTLNYGKIVYIKNIFENGWWEEAYPSSHPLDPPLAISYKNHQKNLAYFSHLAPLILFFFTKDEVKMRGPELNAPIPLNTLLTAIHQFRDMIKIQKESTIAFSAIDKLVALF